MPYVGQAERHRAEFESSGTDADPSTVTLEIMDPDGNVTTPQPVDDDGSGVYHYDLTYSKWGPWVIRWVGTGTVPAAIESTVIVTRSPF